jgi:hypothetical protein
MSLRLSKIVATSLLIVSAHSAIAQNAGAAKPMLASERSDAWKIKNALSAAPKFLADHASVTEWSPTKAGAMRVLRQGDNGWTCMPEGDGLTDRGDRLVFDHGQQRHNPMCADETMMKWMMAIMAGETPHLDRIGMSYMLQGEGAVGAAKRFAGPHIMIALPEADKAILKDVGRYAPTGMPYVYGPGSPSPLLVMPIVRLDQDIVVRPQAGAK